MSTMTEMDIRINTILMEEMGIEEGERRRIVDQDTGIQYQMKGKDIVSPGSIGGKNAIEFDPINNTRMMGFAFGNFVDKLVEEESIPPVSSYYVAPMDNGTGKSRAHIVFDDSTEIVSNAYKNDTVCYADLVLRLNGEEDVDLSEYDIDRKALKKAQAKAKSSVSAPRKRKTTVKKESE